MTTTAMPIQTDLNANLPPAIRLPLTGRHLIEASAGTGKTWTLTGVVLRLIVEAGYPCDKIIATTFTRSAAAEMRQRIRERLQDFYRLLRLVTGSSYASALQQVADPDKPQALNRWLQALVNQIGDPSLIAAVTDPINQHLVQVIARQMFVKPDSMLADPMAKDPSEGEVAQALAIEQTATEQTPDKKTPTVQSRLDFRIALQRTNTALDQLDRLFVSTLDSLCQKWLREFSSETGFSPDVQISNDVQPIIISMIHDQLRAFWAEIDAQEPQVYQLMQANKKLYGADTYAKVVERAMNFYTAPIDNISVQPLDLPHIHALMQQVANDDIDADFARYLDAAYRLSAGFAKHNLHNRFDSFFDIQRRVASGRIADLYATTKPEDDLLKAIKDCVVEGKGFKKGHEAQRDAFIALPMVQALAELSQAKAQLETHINQLNAYFTQFISRYVRDNLPKVLEAQRLTTFTLQLARLNRALEGRQGAALARYIRHQYPVALIDESQDINTEQALLIERIYLSNDNSNGKDGTGQTPPVATQANADANHNPVKENLFLMLVGDPKQAIYGFRGGDVHNYSTLKKLFPHKPLALTENRRSAQALIDSLNGWYGKPADGSNDSQDNHVMLDKTQPYFLGEDIEYHTITATRAQSDLANNRLSAEQNVQVPALYHLRIERNQPIPVDDMPTDNTANDDDASKDTPTVSAANAIAAQILALFDPQQGEWLLDKRPIGLTDICVLAAKNTQLTSVERALHQQGIATLRGGSQSVFADTMSQDLLTLMTALLAPYHKAKIKTLLLTKFFRLTLLQANELFSDIDGPTTDEVGTDQAATAEAGQNLQQLAAQIQALLVEGNERWQKDGFLAAIQWLLTQALTLPEQPPQTFWQRLASDKHGERLLIDLRQLMDIISELWYGQGIGEYQLYEWYALQIQTAPKETWCLQHRLPSDVGVQLMTIHGSKGLEFPIVFVVGLEDAVRLPISQANLYLYSQPSAAGKVSLLSRRLSPVASQADGLLNFKDIELQALLEEKLRLMYVALTRARERLYLVTEASATKSSNNALTAFVTDTASFTLKPETARYAAPVDINSLSKYFNQNLTNYQQAQKTSVLTPIDYDQNIAIIKYDAFKGWANTSFTALSRYINQQRYEMAVHSPDYDGLEDREDTTLPSDERERDVRQDLAKLLTIKGLWLPTPDTKASFLPDEKNPFSAAMPTTLDHVATDPMADWWDGMHPDVEGDAYTHADLDNAEFHHGDFNQQPTHSCHSNDYAPVFEPMPAWHSQSDASMNVMAQTQAVNQGDSADYGVDYNINNGWLDDEALAQSAQGIFNEPDRAVDILLDSLQPVSLLPVAANDPTDESQLLRFRFEKGTSAGTFLHKVLEDLANSYVDDRLDLVAGHKVDGVGGWQPPPRWAVLIDRALRRQQLPNQYYSNILASEGKIAEQANETDPDKLALQPEYLALTQWLNEVIHTPLRASGQRPSDIKLTDKTAEMGFNMRLNRAISLSKLNALFATQGIELNLQAQMSQQSLWRYLRGEIDLVYAHNNRYYVVDYKSNYLGNTFDAYHTAALAHSMSEHRYWLQAAIYQVALHRFLKLRLPQYDIHQHLGAVEYAFIRGMSPHHPDHGRLVWQPDSEFILALDDLFGADIDFVSD